jgi:uncharacterized protein YigE (DUF2233 family)
MNWKHVFNSAHKAWRHIDKAREAANGSGYKFFAFNGVIYWTADCTDTGLHVEDGEII